MSKTQELDSIIQTGLYTQTITSVILFSLLRDKEDVIKRFNEILISFKQELSSDEEQQFQELLDSMYKEKVKELKVELEKSLSDEQINNLVPQLFQFDRAK